MSKKFGGLFRNFSLFVIMAFCSWRADAFINFTYVTWTEYWSVTKGRPYAAWTAKSEATPGVLVEADDGDVVDSAALRPDEVFKNDSDLIEGGKLLLPSGSFLLKMRGGDETEYCTYKFGDRLNNQNFIKKMKVYGELMSYLCMTADDNGNTKQPVIMNGLYPALFTIAKTGSGLFGKKLGAVNSVHLSPSGDKKFENLAYIRIYLIHKSIDNLRAPCLLAKIGAEKMGNNELSFKEMCFTVANNQLSAWGGVFTLVNNTPSIAKIKIDHPMFVENLSPIIRN